MSIKNVDLSFQKLIHLQCIHIICGVCWFKAKMIQCIWQCTVAMLPFLMARSHCTGPRQGTGTGTGQGTMDFYIMLCTVHITQGQGPGTGTGTGTNGLHTHSPPGPVLGLVLSNRFCCTLFHSWTHFLCCNVNSTPHSLSRSRAVWMSYKTVVPKGLSVMALKYLLCFKSALTIFMNKGILRVNLDLCAENA